MKTNDYLYGTDDVPTIPQDVIDARIALLRANLAKVLAEHYLTRDANRANSILKAIKHWENIN